MTPRGKRLLLATAALSTAAAAACGGKKSRPPMGNPKGSHYDLQMVDAAPGDGATATPDAAPAATEP